MRSCHAPPPLFFKFGRTFNPPVSSSRNGGGCTLWFWYKLCISVFYILSSPLHWWSHETPKRGNGIFSKKKKGIILMRCGVLVFPNSPSVLNNTLHEKHPHWKMKCFSLHHWRMKMMKSFHESSFLKFIFF